MTEFEKRIRLWLPVGLIAVGVGLIWLSTQVIFPGFRSPDIVLNSDYILLMGLCLGAGVYKWVKG